MLTFGQAMYQVLKAEHMHVFVFQGVGHGAVFRGGHLMEFVIRTL